MAFHHHVRRHTKRVITAILGGLVVLIGVVLIPYPGPGWLIVFAGFAILSTEFEFARRALEWLKARYEMWANWLKKQHLSIQILVLAMTGLVVAVTVWLLNGFGMINDFLNLGLDWVRSPFVR